MLAGHVLADGTDAAGRQWVVAWHPRGKRRADWVGEVLAAFARTGRGEDG